jgi:hypothetical protein
MQCVKTTRAILTGTSSALFDSAIHCRALVPFSLRATAALSITVCLPCHLT